MSQTISLGRIVHFVLAEGIVRPAIVVQVWDDGKANLQVLTDGGNDDVHLSGRERANILDHKDAPNVVWRTSATEDPEGKRAGSWHWPPRVES